MNRSEYGFAFGSARNPRAAAPTKGPTYDGRSVELRGRAARFCASVGTRRSKGANIVDLGRAPRGRRFTINAFFPSAIAVKTGQSVQFTMAGQNKNEIHTITLGAVTRKDIPFVTNTGIINPIAAYPSDPPTAFPPYTGTNHGNGFLNPGLHDNDSATTTLPPTGSVQFATPGTFQLKCLVHDGMDATVTVTP